MMEGPSWATRMGILGLLQGLHTLSSQEGVQSESAARGQGPEEQQKKG